MKRRRRRYRIIYWGRKVDRVVKNGIIKYPVRAVKIVR